MAETKKVRIADERTPSVCAHRGLSASYPENSLEAYEAAIAAGADEIELDVRLTADGQMVVSHDDKLDRISDAPEGERISTSTLDYLKALNIGAKTGQFARFCTPEEVFARIGGRVILNIHLKEAGPDGCIVTGLCALMEKYGVTDSVYFAGSPRELEAMRRYAPDIPRTAIQLKKDTMGICEMAAQYGCVRAQLWAGIYGPEVIPALHAAGVRVNLYHAETAEELRAAFDEGVDTVLINHADFGTEFLRKYIKERETKNV